MNKLALNFLVAYSDVYNLQDWPVANVIEATLNFLNSDEFMKDFLEHYCLMKYYQLDYEVKECLSYGVDFFAACREWDIEPAPELDTKPIDFESYDKCMEEVCSLEADVLAEEEYEQQLREDCLEEYMWYKYEDYMLWKKNCNVDHH